MNFSLPWPVALNALYSPTKTGRVYMAHAGKQYKQDAAWIAKSQIKKPLDGPLSLVISAYPPDRRRRDLDGLLKITQDLLEGVP